jgi:hypothetical protein
MTDRRRQSRFVFLAPADARLQVTVEGVVERWEGDHAVVISTCTAACGEEFVMQLPSPLGELKSWTVRVLACEPTLIGPAKRFRVRLSVTPAPRPSHGHDLFVA